MVALIAARSERYICGPRALDASRGTAPHTDALIQAHWQKVTRPLLSRFLRAAPTPFRAEIERHDPTALDRASDSDLGPPRVGTPSTLTPSCAREDWGASEASPGGVAAIFGSPVTSGPPTGGSATRVTVDEKAIRRAVLITRRRSILKRFRPGPERRVWLRWAAGLAKSQAPSSRPIVIPSTGRASRINYFLPFSKHRMATKNRMPTKLIVAVGPRAFPKASIHQSDVTPSLLPRTPLNRVRRVIEAPSGFKRACRGTTTSAIGHEESFATQIQISRKRSPVDRGAKCKQR